MENPFRPGSGVLPPYFAGRNQEIDVFKKKMSNGINGGFIQHMAILSSWGSGKTSLLLKFKEIAKDMKCPVLPIQLYSIPEARNFVELFVNSASFVVPPSNWQRFTNSISGFGISIIGSGIQVQRQAGYFEPQTAFQQSLKTIWENSDSRLIVVMIDDVQLIAEREQTLEILRNAFTWASNAGYRFMVVVAGTPDVFEKFQQAHAPLTRFFEPMILKPLSDKECKEAVSEPLKNTSVSFSDDVIDRIAALSEGNPFYVQLLASHAFEHARENGVGVEEFKLAFVSAINDVSVRMFDNMLAGSSPIEKKVLAAMHESGLPLKWGEMLKLAEGAGIKKTSARTAVKRLVDGGLLRQITEGEHEGCYIFRDGLFREYIGAKTRGVS